MDLLFCTKANHRMVRDSYFQLRILNFQFVEYKPFTPPLKFSYLLFASLVLILYIYNEILRNKQDY